MEKGIPPPGGLDVGELRPPQSERARCLLEESGARYRAFVEPLPVVAYTATLDEPSALGVLWALKGLDHPPRVGMLTLYPLDPYRRRCLALDADFFWDKSKDLAAIPR